MHIYAFLYLLKVDFISTEDLLVESFSSYRFLNLGHVQVPGIEDDEMFEETLEAMAVLGFNEEERMGGIDLLYTSTMTIIINY